MTERSAEQAPVESRPDHQDTARIPLAERLQRRIAAADERRSGNQSSRGSPRALPPMPADLAQQRTDERPAPRAASPTAPAATPQTAPRPAEVEPAQRA